MGFRSAHCVAENEMQQFARRGTFQTHGVVYYTSCVLFIPRFLLHVHPAVRVFYGNFNRGRCIACMYIGHVCCVGEI